MVAEKIPKTNEEIQNAIDQYNPEIDYSKLTLMILKNLNKPEEKQKISI